MVSFLMKTPLTAIIFAALFNFIPVFLPVSTGYAEALSAFKMPFLGNIFIIVYGLLVSIVFALVIGNAKDRGIKPVGLALVSLLLTQWVAPLLRQYQFGETTGVMARSDTLFRLAAGSAATVLLGMLAFMLFKLPPVHPPAPGSQPKTPNKYKIKAIDLIIKFIVLPVIYCVVYFLAWYFLLWRSAAARVYYSGVSDVTPFVNTMINMLLTDARQVPMALVKGLVYSLGIFPLLFQLPAKRVVFIISGVLLMMGPALQMLIPSPVMPDAVRTAHLIEMAADAVVFGALSSLMLHLSLHKVEVKQPVASAPKAPKEPADDAKKS